MQRIDNVQVAVRVFDNYIMFADQNKFRMPHVVPLAVRSADDGAFAGGQMMANQVAIHVDLLASKRQFVKGLKTNYESYSSGAIRRA